MAFAGCLVEDFVRLRDIASLYAISHLVKAIDAIATRVRCLVQALHGDTLSFSRCELPVNVHCRVL